MPEVESLPEPSATKHTPLSVDLDGTLIKSDSLVDSLLALVRARPAQLLSLPGAVLRGKAAFKAFVAARGALDVAHLAYNRAVLLYLREEYARGRALYLVTGADRRIAEPVAAHLGIFRGVLASDGAVNLTGRRKRDRLRAEFGGRYSYMGNDTPDLPLLAEAVEAMVANPSLRLRFGMRRCGIRPVRSFIDRRSLLRSLLRAMRPERWTLNLLVFLPLLLAHAASAGRLPAAVVAFFCFSFAASSAYIVDGLLQSEVDRRDTEKCARPFAAGDLSAAAGVSMATLLLFLAFAGARLLPFAFTGWLLFYLSAAVAGCWLLQRTALADALALACFAALRLAAGEAATGVRVSGWLTGASMLLFFLLVLAVRRAGAKHAIEDV